MSVLTPYYYQPGACTCYDCQSTSGSCMKPSLPLGMERPVTGRKPLSSNLRDASTRSQQHHHDTSWLELDPSTSQQQWTIRPVHSSTPSTSCISPSSYSTRSTPDKRRTGLRKSLDRPSETRAVSGPVEKPRVYQQQRGLRHPSATPELRPQKSFPSTRPAFQFPAIDFQRPRTPPALPLRRSAENSVDASVWSGDSATSRSTGLFSHKSSPSTSSSFSVASVSSSSKANACTPDRRPRGDTRDSTHAINTRPPRSSYGVAPLTRQRGVTTPLEPEQLRSFWDDSDSESESGGSAPLKAVVRAVSSLSFHKRQSVESASSTDSSSGASSWHRRANSNAQKVKKKKSTASLWCM